MGHIHEKPYCMSDSNLSTSTDLKYSSYLIVTSEYTYLTYFV